MVTALTAVPSLVGADTASRFASPSVSNLEAELALAIERVRPASVAVKDTQGAFSAVIVSPDGVILTAGHCVDPGTEYTVILPDGRTYPAIGLGKESTVDMGMMRITRTDLTDPLPWVELGRSGELVPGEACFGASYPGEIDHSLGPIIRFGKVTKRKAANGFIQSTVVMEPGDSGGPLFDSSGRLVGIHSQIEVALGHNYDVPIDRFVRNWDRLLDGEAFSLWRESIDALGFEVEATDSGAIEVVSVAVDTAADRAGLTVGDEIVEAGGRAVDRESRVRSAFRRAARRGAHRVPLLIEREGISIGVAYRLSGSSVKSEKAPPTFSPPGRSLPALDGIATGASVAITSQRDGKRIDALGTVITLESGTGYVVVSKSSRVGNDPTVSTLDPAAQSLESTVAIRDEANDLVVLRLGADTPAIDAVDWTEFANPKRGALVASAGRDRSSDLCIVGADLRPIPADLVLGVQISETTLPAITVTRVYPDSPAAIARIEVGDVLEEIEGKRLEKRSDLTGTLSELGTPREITIQIKRGDQSLAVRATPKPRGNPGGGASYHAADAVPAGISERRVGFANAFPVDAPRTPAECGAPLFDTAGKLVGIVIARRSRTQCLALGSETIRSLIERAVVQPRSETL